MSLDAETCPDATKPSSIFAADQMPGASHAMFKLLQRIHTDTGKINKCTMSLQQDTHQEVHVNDSERPRTYLGSFEGVRGSVSNGLGAERRMVPFGLTASFSGDRVSSRRLLIRIACSVASLSFLSCPLSRAFSSSTASNSDVSKFITGSAGVHGGTLAKLASVEGTPVASPWQACSSV